MNSVNQFSHFLQRTKERYGLELTLEDLQTIAEDIKSGKAKLIRANSRGFQYKVRFGSTLLIVVLNRSQSAFVTALPMKPGKEQVSFDGHQYTYEDSLYFNWLFKRHFKPNWQGKVYCPKCKQTHVEVDLGKNRFKCPNCYHIVKFKKHKMPDVLMTTVANGQFVTGLRLSIDLWWYLYKTEQTFAYEDIVVKPIIVDNDRLEYTIQYNGKDKVLPREFYSVEQLKEIVNGQEILSGTE